MAKKTKTKKRIASKKTMNPRGVMNVPAGFRPDGSILKNGGKKK